ncbi:MAG: AarF/ABC1/UbiB kinase family protein, partial [Actinomycetia bacterium]|nr:AarF/ABC1/UbiB kinase family protein [Actinomycetes bacterium]
MVSTDTSLKVATAVVCAVAVARTARRYGDKHDIHPIAHSSRSQRTTQMAKLGARRGVDRALTAVRARLGSDERRRRLVAELELREARDVVDSLGQMKGALMKLGQMASYLDDGLPEPMRIALAELHSDAPPMSGDLALTEIERSLGRPLLTLFEHVHPEPIAAASIGQVHRATTRDGLDVAVKVQYPGIADAIAADLDNTKTLAGILGLVFPGLDSSTLVEELRDRILEELDYEHEALNQHAFAEYYAGHPHIWVPRVIDVLSSATVLTTEFVAGRPFEDVFELDQHQRDHYAEILYRFVFRSLNRQLAFNADPHPGNYLL